MAWDAFISHSAKDKTIADAMCVELEAGGIRCWTAPRDILPGLDWGEAIIDAINEAKLIILIVSSNANNSYQIKREIERAVNRGKIVIPFRIENVPLSKSLEYYVSTSHWLDAFTPPLERHLQQLSDTVKLLLARLNAEVQPDSFQPCVHCGSQNRKGTDVCSACGLSLTGSSAQREPDPQKDLYAASALEPEDLRSLPPINEPPSEKRKGKIAERKSASRRPVIIGVTSLLIIIAVLSGILVYFKIMSRSDPMSAAEIARAYTGAVVYIEAGWKLIHNPSGGQIYHKYIPNQWKDGRGTSHAIVNDGRSAVAAYIVVGQDAAVEPLLTLDNMAGPPVSGEHSGTGFAVTSNGFILTSGEVGAYWRTSFQFPPSSTPGVVISNGEIALGTDGKPLRVAAPTDWIPSETKQEGQTLQGGFDGRNDYLNVTFAKSEVTIPAKLVQVSSRHDVAMLKIDVPGSALYVELNDNYNTIKQGDASIVIGYPVSSTPVYGVARSQDGSNRASQIKIIPDPTMSVGNIGRVIRGQDSNGTSKDTLYSKFGDAYQLMLNSTAAGNSGAPVFDDHGRVIAIVFAGRTIGGQSSTYAVPIRYAKELMITTAPSSK